MRLFVVGLTALVLATFPLSVSAADPPIQVKLIDSGAIWNQAYNNSFTDVVRFQDKFYVCLREATAHGVHGDGKVRVIRSAGGSGNIGGWTWESMACLDYENPAHPNWDVRDPGLTVTPDGRLLLNVFTTALDDYGAHQSPAWFSGNGVDWTDGPHELIGVSNQVLWRVAWHPDGALYGTAYGPTGGSSTKNRLYRSVYHPEAADPLDFQVHVPTLLPNNSTTEAALLFRRGGGHTAVALVRRGDEPYGTSWVGTARGDYKTWTWHKLSGRCELGGQDILELPDGNIVAATRFNNTRTSLCWLDPDGGKIFEMLQLPNGAHGGYCGLVWQDDFLWVSYYGNVAGDKGTIYLAKVAVTLVPEPSTLMMVLPIGGLVFARLVRRGRRCRRLFHSR